MRKISQAYTVVVVLQLALVLSAPAASQLEGMQVGSVALTTLEQSQSQVYIHNFDAPFSATPQLALAITALDQNALALDTSFHVMPQSLTATGLTLSWTRNLQKWARLTLKYLASVRSDIMLGCRQSVVSQGSNTTVLSIATDPVPNFNTSVLRTFLLGCDSSTGSVECGLLPKSVKSSSINIEIYGTDMVNVTVSFGFLVFSPSTAGFTSYGGYLTNQSFKGSLTTDLHKSIAYTPYRFHGFSYLNYSTASPILIASYIDDDLVIQVQSESLLGRYALFHVIFGKTAKNACTDSSMPFQHLAECVAECPQETYAFSYSDGGKGCRSCSPLLGLVLEDGACIAVNMTKVRRNVTNLVSLFRQGESKTITTVQETTTTQTSTTSQAASATQTTQASQPPPQPAQQPQALPIDNNLQNNQNYQQSQPTQTALPTIAPSSQTYESAPQASESNSASTYGSGSSIGSSSNSAPATAQITQTATTYQTQYSTASQPPSTNPPPSMSPPPPPTTAQVASTVSSMYSPPSCATNQFLVNGVCVCQVGFTSINGYCSPISFADPDLTPIVIDALPISSDTPVTPSSQSYNAPPTPPTTQPYVSPPAPIDCGEGHDNGYGVCVCPAGLQFSQGRCIYVAQNPPIPPPPAVAPTAVVTPHACGINMVFDQKEQKCVCIRNFVFDINGDCRSCGKNSEEKHGRCECLQGFVFKDGECVAVNSRESQNNRTNSSSERDSRNRDKKDNQDNNNNSTNQSCGNGVIEGNEQCDDSNTKGGDGCSSLCKVEMGYKCDKAPSVCTLLQPAPPLPSPNSNITYTDGKNQTAAGSSSGGGSNSSGSGASNNLSLVGSVMANNNQVFLTLDTQTAFSFADQSAMKSFMKAKFVGCAPPTLFCSQQANKKNLFDCLLIFPSGVPNKAFTADFSYSYQSAAGSCSVPIDALKVQLDKANARTNSRGGANGRVA